MRDDVPGPELLEPVSKLHFGLGVELKALAWYQERVPEAQLLARGFRWKGGEIDLILEEPCRGRSGRRELVFIEVRARLPGSWVDGVQSVDPPKLRRLRNGMALFLSRYRGRAQSLRLDLVAWDGTQWEHVRDAWVGD